MLKDHRCTCTGATCKVCRHLGRQRAAAVRKLDLAPAGPTAAGPSRREPRGAWPGPDGGH